MASSTETFASISTSKDRAASTRRGVCFFGPRDYHPGYYAYFVHDPEGDNIEAALHDYQA